MLVVGVDASPLRIAYAVTHSDSEAILNYAMLPTRNGLEDRRTAWLAIRDSLRRIEDEARDDVGLVGVEDVWFGLNKRGVLNHTLSVGQTMAWASTAFPEARIELVSAQSWRAACGLPKSGKDAARAYAESLVGPIASQDEADAICISLATLRRDAGSD